MNTNQVFAFFEGIKANFCYFFQFLINGELRKSGNILSFFILLRVNTCVLWDGVLAVCLFVSYSNLLSKIYHTSIYFWLNNVDATAGINFISSIQYSGGCRGNVGSFFTCAAFKKTLSEQMLSNEAYRCKWRRGDVKVSRQGKRKKKKSYVC